MRNARTFVAFGLGIAATLLVSATLPTQEEGGMGATKDAAFGMDDTAMQAAAPGKMHRRLAPLEGEWIMNVKWRMGPDGEWIESKAEATREWIYDGRFLKEKVSGETPMGPFQGMALMGYDNVREEYVSIWIDNTATGIQVSRGEAIDDEKVIETEGEMSNAMTGEANQWFRERMEIVSNDENLFQIFHKGPDGREYLGLEIVAKRR